ncbi:MAG: cobyrinate a,c-diamide synthase [Mogibacterium sp.]|nr:cobyrinate a,c-diamide synthase [Mogibacterium sp.]
MKLPRVMIAAPKSGSGKTLITCGLLEALRRRGTDVRAYKCGPDYIDPMFHRSVLGIPGGNLDTFFSTEDEIRRTLAGCGSEAAVIEGVMGIYDGVTGMQGKGSCYDVASASSTPVVLVFDVKGMGQTMLSVIKGVLLDDRRSLIRGIVLNRISGGYFRQIEPLVSGMLDKISADRGVKVCLLGGIPASSDINLESRHLGLIMPGDIEDLKDRLTHAADLMEENLDMDAFAEIMQGAAELDAKGAAIEAMAGESDMPCLAVARDEAFCFYYEENLRMLRSAGIRIKEFSPLHDSCVPEEADGLLLGGGYPELYAAQLSSNTTMIGSIKDAIKTGMPSLAECGGFMYLLEELENKEGKAFGMTGVIKGRTSWTGKLSRFGYAEVSGETEGTLLSGLSVKAHEFHYYDSSNNGADAIAEKPGSGRSWKCIHAGSDHIWGYPHLWYPSCPELAGRFRDAMNEYRKKRKDG